MSIECIKIVCVNCN